MIEETKDERDFNFNVSKWKQIKKSGMGVNDNKVKYPRKFIIPNKKQIQKLIYITIKEYRKLKKKEKRKK
jgi:hypothetical protein